MEEKYECAQLDGDGMYVENQGFEELRIEVWNGEYYNTMYLSLEDSIRLKEQLNTFIENHKTKGETK
ncbi:hypothetical protein vBPpSSYP_218 [Pseudomonas phage vB_PpS_SYP]|nr:hypothetical protein vBPpSSYP_218 [Pseudomonas phage vB_PpS_SYP]